MGDAKRRQLLAPKSEQACPPAKSSIEDYVALGKTLFARDTIDRFDKRKWELSAYADNNLMSTSLPHFVECVLVYKPVGICWNQIQKGQYSNLPASFNFSDLLKSFCCYYLSVYPGVQCPPGFKKWFHRRHTQNLEQRYQSLLPAA